MGIAVVGSGVLGFGTPFIIYSDLFGAVNIHDLNRVVTVLRGFSFGGSSKEFLASISCVIYTKATDEFAEYGKFVEISAKPTIRKVVDP